MILSKMLRLIGFALASVILIFPANVFAASVTLRWSANTEPDIGSYNVYYGSFSRSYGNPIPVGNVTSYTVNQLTDGQTYYFAVTALDTSGNESGVSLEVSAQATTPPPPPIDSVTLSTSLSSPQIEGQIVSFDASASGGSGDYEYRFWERGPHTNNAFIVAQDFSSNPSFDWNSSGKIGENSIVVWCRNAGTTQVEHAGKYFTINANQTPSIPPPLDSVTLSTSLSSPQVEGRIVRFNASASGGSGDYEYRFWERGPHTNNAFIVAQDFSSNPSFDWNSSGKIGESSIVVWCRNAGTTQVEYSGKYFTINSNQSSGEPQPHSVTLSTSLSSPQIEGRIVRFDAWARGGSGDYEYRFWERGPHTNNAFVVAQDFSSNSSFHWNSSGKVGESSIVVWCRNAGTNPDGSEIQYTGRYFTVR